MWMLPGFRATLALTLAVTKSARCRSCLGKKQTKTSFAGSITATMSIPFAPTLMTSEPKALVWLSSRMASCCSSFPDSKVHCTQHTVRVKDLCMLQAAIGDENESIYVRVLDVDVRNGAISASVIR
jgi:hypothetical protein